MSNRPTLDTRRAIVGPTGAPNSYFVDFWARFDSAVSSGAALTSDQSVSTPYAAPDAASARVGTEYAETTADRSGTAYSAAPSPVRVSTTY